MASIIDLDNIDASLADSSGGGGTLIPDGTYEAEVTSAEYEVDEKSREKIALTFKITEGEHAGSSIKSWNYLHTPKCKEITMEQLAALGLPDRFHPANAKQLVGKRARIVTAVSEDGQYSNVKFINQASLPPGTYRGVVSQAEKQTSRNGKDFLRVAFKVREGDFSGMLIFDRWYLTDKSLPYTGAKIKKLGVTGKFNPDSVSSVQQLLGKKVEITTNLTEGDAGRKYTNVVKLDAFSGSFGGSDSVVDVDASAVAGAIVVEDPEIEDDMPF